MLIFAHPLLVIAITVLAAFVVSAWLLRGQP